MNPPRQALQAYIEFFEQLSRADLQRFERIFSEDVHFKDPFNDVRGPDALRRIFSHLFEQCAEPRFTVTDACGCDDRAYLRWDFHSGSRGGAEGLQLHGLSRVRFDAQGRVCEHIDYWDPAEQIYHRVPLLGWLLDRLRNRLSASLRTNRRL